MKIYICTNKFQKVAAKVAAYSFSRLGYNDIEKTNHIGQLSDLVELRIWHNQVDDISGLAGCPNLSSLRAAHNDVSDIAVLEFLPDLSFINLRSNDLTDLTPLMNNLDFAAGDQIYIHGNNIDCANQTGVIQTILDRGAKVNDNTCN